MLACPRASCHNTDDYYANPSYFEARNMSLPSYEAMNSKVHVLASEKTRSREMAGGRYRHDKHCPAERGKDPTTPRDYHLVPQERATKEQRTAQIRRTNWSAVFQNAMDSSLERMASGA